MAIPSISAPRPAPLLWALRDHFGLAGTKFGCGVAVCGAGTVHVNGEPTRDRVTPVSAHTTVVHREVGVNDRLGIEIA